MESALVAQRLKCLPGMRETQVRSLGWEDPLEKEMATHSSILAWRIPRMEEPGGLQSTGVAKSRTRLHFHFQRVYENKISVPEMQSTKHGCFAYIKIQRFESYTFCNLGS